MGYTQTMINLRDQNPVFISAKLTVSWAGNQPHRSIQLSRKNFRKFARYFKNIKIIFGPLEIVRHYYSCGLAGSGHDQHQIRRRHHLR